MKLLLLSTLLILSGCGLRQTAHEYCSEDKNLSRYDSYDQCYAERIEKKRAISEALSHMGDGFKSSSSSSSTAFTPRPQSIQCTTQTINGISSTVCN